MIDHTVLPHDVEVYSKGNQVPHDEKVQTNNHLLQYDHIKGKKDDHTVPHDVEAKMIDHIVLPYSKVYSIGNQVPYDEKVQSDNHLLQFNHVKGKKDDHTVPHDAEARTIDHTVLPHDVEVYSNGNSLFTDWFITYRFFSNLP